MTALRTSVGKPAIRRDTPEQLGDIRHFAIDAATGRLSHVVVSAGRSALLIDWASVATLGPDAVIVTESRAPTEADERAVAGALDPLGKPVLSDRGNEIGQTTDVTVDDDGTVSEFITDRGSIAGARLLGIGSYAVVVVADSDEA